MTEDEFPFKVGDVVWHVKHSEARRCTVTRFSTWKFEPHDVATISVAFEDGQHETCVPNSLQLAPPTPPAKRYMTFEEAVAGCRFKPGDRVMQSNYGVGVVLGYSPTLTMRVDFKYVGERGVDPQSSNVWFAEPGDEDWNPLVSPEPEPVDAPEMATIENLGRQIDVWTSRVQGFAHGFDCSEEYQQDVMVRASVHGVLNGLRQKGVSVPVALQLRLDEADRRFLALTEDGDCIWHDSERYDRDVFWYYFRQLKA